MVSLPKCAGCEYNNFMKVTCKLYPNGIPDDIFVEIKKCNYYKKRKENVSKRKINESVDKMSTNSFFITAFSHNRLEF